jgi:hypothetical protein
LRESADCPNVSLVVRPLRTRTLPLVVSVAFGCSGDASHATDGAASTGTSNDSPTSSGDDTGADTSTGGVVEDPPVTPAPGGIRRLRADQYVGTVGVLLGGDAAAVAAPPGDTSVLGFDAIGSAHVPLSPGAVEQYERSALEIGKAAAAAPYTLAEIAPCVIEQSPGDACFGDVADALGRAAWRRPITDSERARLVEIGSAAFELGDGSFELGLAYEIATILQSPAFLYAVELGEIQDDGANVLTTNEWVTRLAMVVLGRAPSAQTFAQLDAGMFDGTDAPRTLASSWLEQAEARGAMVGFFDELLRLREVESLSKDPAQFEHFSAALAASARIESRMLVEDVVFPADGAGDLRRLFDADYTFVDAQLAALYGIDAPATDFARVDLPESRRGILAHASILAVGSHYDRNSPTRRGLLVQRNLLCNDVPPPPGDVDINLPEPDEPTTLRERLEGHLAQGGTCVGCHGQTDPIGFAFEHFDASGAWRELDAGFTIDASGDVDGLGAFDGATELSILVRDDPRLAACIVRNLYRHALGHAEDVGTAALREAIAAELEATDFDLRTLVVELVDSDAFLRVGEPK